MEGALVFTVFFVLIFGIMDFGRMVWSYTLISHAAREATRYAIVHGSASGHVASQSQIKDVVKNSAVGLDPASLSTTVTFTPDQSTGSTAKVSVTYNFSPIVPYMPGGPITLKSSSQMMIFQ